MELSSLELERKNNEESTDHLSHRFGVRSGISLVKKHEVRLLSAALLSTSFKIIYARI